VDRLISRLSIGGRLTSIVLMAIIGVIALNGITVTLLSDALISADQSPLANDALQEPLRLISACVVGLAALLWCAGWLIALSMTGPLNALTPLLQDVVEDGKVYRRSPWTCMAQ